MGDSDDEFDRKKGRDKFRRERNDYDKRNDDRRRDSWEDRRPSGRGGQRGWRGGSSMRSRDSSWSGRGGMRDRRDMYSRPDYSRPYDDRRRDRYSPGHYDNGHPAKRMRRDWDDSGYPGGMYESPFRVSNGPPGSAAWRAEMDMNAPDRPGFGEREGGEVDYPTQPAMMTFKAFLNKQDDTISQEDAIKLFSEYKLDFKRQQINEFFLAHKEEEWFKLKFHPEECDKRQVETKAALKRRQKVFETVMVEKKMMEGITADIEHTDPLVKILDASVILLEGGNDLDLTILDNPPPEEPEERSRQNSESAPTAVAAGDNAASEKTDKVENGTDGEDGEIKEKDDEDDEKPMAVDEPKDDNKEAAPPKDLEMDITPEQEELKKAAMEYQKQQEEAAAKVKEQRRAKKKSQRKKSDYSYESGSESGSESDSDSEPAPPGLEDDPGPPGVDPAEDEGDKKKKEEDKEETPNKENKESTEEKDNKDEKKEGEEGEAKPKEEGEAEEKEKEPKPRPLHKTNSIFLRNLAPTITKTEVEAVCKRYPGFMRVALQDPQPERRFLRRGWVTFSKECNIKEVCWSLNNIRLRECELGATLNRELRLRVRGANGLTVHKQVMRNDIKMAAKIIQLLDDKWGVWTDEEEEKKDQEKEPQFGFVSKNPVLKNITDYLVDEGSFEEDELVGESDEDKKDSNPEISIERDDSLSKVLDKMILYLRIVHSVDYYSANEYSNEDEMPHRCGIMHARGTPPGATATIKQNDVNEWMSSFETKMKPFLEGTQTITDTEANQLGKKDPDSEVEKFVQANTQELAKDKWLCPLSGKKFKGPDFVRKHIFNKHTEKIDEVKQEVKYFNNYLLDSKRPSLPEHPSSRPKPPPPPQPPAPSPQQPSPQHTSVLSRVGDPYTNRMGGYGAAGYSSPFTVRDRPPPDAYRRGGGGGRPYRRSDPRQLIQYTDLDAPDDGDIF